MSKKYLWEIEVTARKTVQFYGTEKEADVVGNYLELDNAAFTATRVKASDSPVATIFAGNLRHAEIRVNKYNAPTGESEVKE